MPPPQEIINRAPREAMDVFIMGANDKGQLCMGPGYRERTIVQKPARNPYLSEDHQTVAIAVGNNHCLALTADNRVLSWGSNTHGALGRTTRLWQLGDGRWVPWSRVEGEDDNPNSPEGRRIDSILQTPRHINSIAIERGTVFTQVAVTDHASFALTETGEVYGWGAFEYYGGENDAVHRLYAFHPYHMEWPEQGPLRNQPSPLKIRFPTDNPQIIQIACGSNHVLALSKSGLVYSWGTPDMNILGRRYLSRRLRNPRYRHDPYGNMNHPFAPGVVANLVNIRYVACGANFSFAVTKPLTRGNRKGTQLCYVWGQNDDMQTTLPLSKAPFVETPGHPDAPDGNRMRVVLYPTEAPWLSGIGHMDEEPESAIKTISGALRYGLAIRRNGWGEVWGNEHEMPNAMGVVNQDNEPMIPAIPPGNDYTQAPQFAGWHYFHDNRRWDQVATGRQHSIAVDQDGKVYVWGSNAQNQCGVPRPTGYPNIDVIDRPTLLQSFIEGRITLFVGAGARYSVFGFAKGRFRNEDGGNVDDVEVPADFRRSILDFNDEDVEVGGD
ncbi:RCC1/BLIP-II [Neurospora tetrasperma FGSC 2509]|nr:RCC1/BLIP-II [Neurospora tetrasperma FGSC 2509]